MLPQVIFEINFIQFSDLLIVQTRQRFAERIRTGKDENICHIFRKDIYFVDTVTLFCQCFIQSISKR